MDNQTNSKEKLIELIEAYAIAKTTTNTIIVSLVASALRTFLDSVEITAVAIDHKTVKTVKHKTEPSGEFE